MKPQNRSNLHEKHLWTSLLLAIHPVSGTPEDYWLNNVSAHGVTASASGGTGGWL
jgi:hypothetical protein